MANFFKNITKFFPTVKAQEEEDLVDPQTTLREQCNERGGIKALLEKYQSCNDRVHSKSQTAETCVEELIDYLGELDHCVQHSLFSKLK